MKHRILSVLLVLALALTLLPAGVLAAGPVAVEIGGTALQDGQPYETRGGYAVLNGDELTFCDLTLETTVSDSESAITVTGDVTLKLEGSSTVISYNTAAILVDGDLTVTGDGSLRVHGHFHAIHADNFVMESGTVAASSERESGGNGITARTASFRGGSLTVEADYPFFRPNEECEIDPEVTVDAAGVTVWYGFRDQEPVRMDYAAAGDLAIRDAEGMIYHRFWISDEAAETCPDTLEFPYDLRIGGVYVTEDNCADVMGDGSVTFDPETGVLTLTDAQLTCSGNALFATGMDLTVEINGSCSLISTGETAVQVDFGDLTIRGGQLTVSGGTFGIFTYGGDLTVDDVALELTSAEGNGINVLEGSILLTDSVVHIESENRAINVPNGAMDILYSDVFTRGLGSYGINVGTTLTVDHSTMENYGRLYQGGQDDGSGNISYDNGDDGLDSRNFVILDSTVRSTGGEDGAWLSGYLTIERSDVTFSGSQNAVQVNGGPVTVTDSTLSAILQDIGDDPSYGMDIAIYAKRDIIISRSDVIAESREGAPAIAVLKGNAGIYTDFIRKIEQVGVAGSSGAVTQVLTFADENGDFLQRVELRRYSIFEEEESAAADAAELPFTDVKKSDWFCDEVREAWANGLIHGVTETSFCPDDTLTVAQTVKLAAALHQREVFGEVTLENGDPVWYSTYVDYAMEAGILSEAYGSYPAQQMNAPISRREFVSIFFGAMPEGSYVSRNEVADNAIPDVKITDPCADEIYTFYRAGILIGSDAAGTFFPESTIRRSEAAAILIRMYDAAARQSIAPAN